ncbi:hypothetical protein J3A84_08975 [Proteiniclasticum sp. SCR006]|uniref:Uncharacterized protein n=1 Tax=Proteiniclasticum aestuarii TaxID=2817862 RepID=A0A939H6I3_9CLOT|nr:hypothetical protein [Proteiniclasticum aestuarii]MBO1265157.1 hypothetical protein [Proteiniclasticum aestuarii]
MEINNVKIEISEEMQKALAEIVRCDIDDLSVKLSKVASAATQEYVKMIIGEKIFTRGSDIREYRLYLLIINYFDGIIPDESTISTLFQTTNSESKSLLRSTLAKYHFLLKQPINETIIKILSRIKPKGDESFYVIKNIPINMIDEMNKIVSEIDGSHDQIRKQRGTLQGYEIPKATYDELMKFLGVTK